MSKPQLSFLEFQTLVLIFAANADYEYDEKEANFIKSRSSVSVYNEMMALFEETSDYNILRTILEHKNRYCNSQEKKDELYKLIIYLFKLDGEYSRPEKIFLEFLDRMIKTK